MKVTLLTSPINPEEELMKDIVSAINIAISENVSGDYQLLGLNPYHSNSYFQLIWDHIHTNLSSIPYIIGGYTKRGFWNMYTIFDPSTGYLYSFMREKRFHQIAKRQKPTMHYVQAMATTCNDDLEPTQLTLFPMEPDKAEAKSIVDSICNSLGISSNNVKAHKVILFSTSHSMLTYVRCCTVDRMLEVHESINLTPYINVLENIVVEAVDDPISKSNNPTQGLKFTAKAKKKKELNDNLSFASSDIKEEKNK